MSLDLSIIGIVFALILLLIFFSAVVLYLAFRIKETFRKETRKGFTIVKIGFLIGILFLSGGMFYFFASTLGNIGGTSTSNPYLNLALSYPSSVAFDSVCTVNFTVINPTSATAHGSTIQANVFFADFLIQSCTHEVVGNVINVGDVPPGTTIVSLSLSTPGKPGTVTDTVSLLYQEMTAPVTQEITVSVSGGTIPTPTPSSSPTPLPSATPSPSSDLPLTLTVSYPPSVTSNTNVTMSFTLRNPTTATAHGATIEANALFANFVVVSSTREIVGNVINIGDVPPGTTIISITLLSPSKPGTVTDTVSLLYQETTNPITQGISISVRGGQ